MARTPAQIAADDALTAAIDAARVAYFPEDAGRLLPGYRTVGLLTEAQYHRLGRMRSDD